MLRDCIFGEVNIFRALRLLLSILRNPDGLEAVLSPKITGKAKLEYHAREFMALIPTDGLDHEARIQHAFRCARAWMKELDA